MAPFIALIGSLLLFRGLGWIGLDFLDDWQTSLRFAVAVMFLLTASAHWGKKRADLVRMVPPALPCREGLVTLTGWLEIAGAAGMLLPAAAPSASIGLAVMMLAMFPANVHAARAKLTLGGRPVTPLGLRVVLLLVFEAAVLAAGLG